MDQDNDGGPRLRRSQRVTQLRADSNPPFDPKVVMESRQQQQTPNTTTPNESPTSTRSETSQSASAEEGRRTAGALRAHPQQLNDSVKIFKHAWNELDEAEEREANKVSDDYVRTIRRRLSTLEDRNQRLIAHRSSQNLRTSQFSPLTKPILLLCDVSTFNLGNCAFLFTY
jgi:hypothetical protein